MKICVISDTHAMSINGLSHQLVSHLNKADVIIHAGDMTEKQLLDDLGNIAEVRAVCGNMDSFELKQLLPATVLFDIMGTTIALTHGEGSRHGLRVRVRNMFASSPDIIIYGHSHHAECVSYQGAFMLNPGPASRSFAWLDIEKGLKAEIIHL